MPRKKKNARNEDRPRKTRVKPPRQHRQYDNISPGILVAVAEWRGGGKVEYSIGRKAL